jgi:hypothetical protein
MRSLFHRCRSSRVLIYPAIIAVVVLVVVAVVAVVSTLDSTLLGGQVRLCRWRKSGRKEETERERKRKAKRRARGGLRLGISTYVSIGCNLRWWCNRTERFPGLDDDSSHGPSVFFSLS